VMNQEPLISKDGEVRELTADDMHLFSSTSKVLPAELLSVLPTHGRPRKEETKISTTVRFDADILKFFRAKGKGWQTRINDALKEYVASHK